MHSCEVSWWETSNLIVVALQLAAIRMSLGTHEKDKACTYTPVLVLLAERATKWNELLQDTAT